MKPRYPGEGRPIVIGESYAIASRVLGGQRRINVYLPEGYSSSHRRFRVLFLLDGGELEDFFHVSALAQITAAYGQGEQMIVVGIEGIDRRHDLTSPSSVIADRKVAPTAGGAATYRRFLVDELKPWTAAHFRTDGQSTLMGESLAGLFVLETLLNEPRAFSDYISVSPSLWWDGGRLASNAAAALRRGNFTGRRAYVAFETPAPPKAAAAKDQALQNRLQAAFGRARPIGLHWTIAHSAEGHGSIYHPAAYQAFRKFYSTSPGR